MLQRHRDALTQLLAVLNTGEAIVPGPIDAKRLVMRIDLKTPGWTSEDLRKEFHRLDPYALQFPTDATGDPLQNVAHDVERRLGEMDTHFPPYVRVDWFVATFSDPDRAEAF